MEVRLGKHYICEVRGGDEIPSITVMVNIAENPTPYQSVSLNLTRIILIEYGCSLLINVFKLSSLNYLSTTNTTLKFSILFIILIITFSQICLDDSA